MLEELEPLIASMRLRTLIVDDEPVARKILREELELVEDVEIVAEADSGAAALEQIARHQPDLVFLDLHMPAMGGLDVVRRLKRGTHIPVIVIVTAYDQFAIQAFEAGAIDYLLKPVGQERLAEAVERARRLTARDAVERVAQGDLVWIITAKRKYLATQTLKVLQDRLSNSSFRRIHRNALVNIDHVRKMSPLSSQRWLITLANNLEFIVSKRQARSVRQLLNW